MTNKMGDGFGDKPQSPHFSERLHAHFARQDEDPEYKLFEEHFDELRKEHIENKRSLEGLWKFMTDDAKAHDKLFNVGLPKFRKWWYEKAPEDKKTRNRTASSNVEDKATSTQSE